MPAFVLTAHLVDVHTRSTYPVHLTVSDGRIADIAPADAAPAQYLLPGFVDAHVHIESAMLTPAQFARLAVVHGTVATVSDPHEIANVVGRAGVTYMIEDGARVPFKFYFGAPSCVPATPFETAGDALDVATVDELLARPEVRYLSEMMNWPGVLHADPEVMAKIASAQRHGKPVDGHAPGLRGDDALRYAAAGISTDHECFTAAEARDKVAAGMHILIREGSAARNFDALVELLAEFPDRIMFCSDDKHPDGLVVSHIDDLVRRALQRGHNLYDVLRAASVNPVRHYGLPVGLLRVGDPADFIVVENLQDMRVRATYLEGQLVAADGRSRLPDLRSRPINCFVARPVHTDELRVAHAGTHLRVITATDGQLVTGCEVYAHQQTEDWISARADEDLLKLVVVNRYAAAPAAVAFVRGFGPLHGALASSVAHDSHNLIAVGDDDEALARALNALMDARGGIAVVQQGQTHLLPLPIAGLMTDADGYAVAREYAHLDQLAKAAGSTLAAPFMTLSFMALLVIPDLKLSDRGLFDGQQFQFTASIFNTDE